MTSMRFVAIFLVLLATPVRAAPPPLLDFNVIAEDEHKSTDCAVTFDDGPGKHTGRLLDLLAQRQIKATFFVLGEHVRQYPDIIKRMAEEGHEIEVHTWDHPDMRKLDDAARTRELVETEKVLVALGIEPHYFRPPYGAYNKDVVEDARREGLEVVLWSHDSLDWRYHSVADIEGNVLPVRAKTGGHGIFLFHDIHDTTIAAIPTVLDALKSNGCHFVTVAEWQTATGAPALPQGEPQ